RNAVGNSLNRLKRRSQRTRYCEVNLVCFVVRVFSEIRRVCSGRNDILLIRLAEQIHISYVKADRNRLFLARLKLDLLEALELFCRSCSNARVRMRNVELNDFLACYGAGIGYVYSERYRSVR